MAAPPASTRNCRRRILPSRGSNAPYSAPPLTPWQRPADAACYTCPTPGTKKTDSTKLDQIITTLAGVVEGFRKRFDKIDREMVTKDQIIALHGQVSAIERQLREAKTEVRLGALEEKVFGAPRC